MKKLVLLWLALGLANCTTYQHSAQAPRPARHTYHQAERQHARARHRQVPLNLPWNYMKKLYPLLEKALIAGSLLYLLFSIAGCAATADLPTVLSAPVDSTVARQVAARRQQLVHTGRVKFKGPVTLQIGGAGNTGTSTDATKAKAPVAAAPAATATQTKVGGLPWWAYLIGGLMLLGAGFALRSRLKTPLPL